MKLEERNDLADEVYRDGIRGRGRTFEELSPTGRTDDPDLVRKSLSEEGWGCAKALAAGPFVDSREIFAAGFLTGIVAAHREGLAWAEWIIQSDLVPLVNLGSMRAAARRIAAGASVPEE